MAQANSDRFLGLASIYDSSRPSVPKVALELILSYLPRTPALVVDLGCGTGLSTRPWLEILSSNQGQAKLIGIDPNPEMLSQANSFKSPIIYQQGFSHSTGLDSSSVDIVCISQAFHWMDPTTTLAEVSRVLKPGGILAVIDAVWPPIIPGCWRSEKAFEECRNNCDVLVQTRGLAPGLQRFDKKHHLESIKERSPQGCFEWTREMFVHSEDVGSFQRLVVLEESQGGVKTALKGGLTREETGLLELEKVAEKEMGNKPRKWIWSYKIQLALKKT